MFPSYLMFMRLFEGCACGQSSIYLLGLIWRAKVLPNDKITNSTKSSNYSKVVNLIV